MINLRIRPRGWLYAGAVSLMLGGLLPAQALAASSALAISSVAVSATAPNMFVYVTVTNRSGSRSLIVTGSSLKMRWTSSGSGYYDTATLVAVSTNGSWAEVPSGYSAVVDPGQSLTVELEFYAPYYNAFSSTPSDLRLVYATYGLQLTTPIALSQSQLQQMDALVRASAFDLAEQSFSDALSQAKAAATKIPQLFTTLTLDSKTLATDQNAIRQAFTSLEDDMAYDDATQSDDDTLQSDFENEAAQYRAIKATKQEMPQAVSVFDKDMDTLKKEQSELGTLLLIDPAKSFVVSGLRKSIQSAVASFPKGVSAFQLKSDHSDLFSVDAEDNTDVRGIYQLGVKIYGDPQMFSLISRFHDIVKIAKDGSSKQLDNALGVLGGAQAALAVPASYFHRWTWDDQEGDNIYGDMMHLAFHPTASEFHALSPTKLVTEMLDATDAIANLSVFIPELDLDGVPSPWDQQTLTKVTYGNQTVYMLTVWMTPHQSDQIILVGENASGQYSVLAHIKNIGKVEDQYYFTTTSLAPLDAIARTVWNFLGA